MRQDPQETSPDNGRRVRAIALRPEERRAIVEAFFSRCPVGGQGAFGFGQAILDFQAWEIASGRIVSGGGSPWWSGVNGLMVLDILAADDPTTNASPAVGAWRAYAAAGAGQLELWQAHQLSLHAGVGSCAPLLATETKAEREFAAAAIDIVDRTALAGSATDTSALAEFTARYYPESYPIVPEAVARIEAMRARTADRLRDGDGTIFADVGLDSTRWL